MNRHTGAIDALFLDHRDALIRTVLGIVPCRATAEDLVQETYLRASAAANRQSIRHPKPFLFRTARNLALDRRRRQAIEEWHRPPTAADPAPAPEQTFAGRQSLAAVDTALQVLPPDCRQAFLMHRLDGLSHKQIAARLEISASMVDKHIRRAMGACRRALFDE